MIATVTFNAFGEGTIVLYAQADVSTTESEPFKAYFGVTGPGGVTVKAFPSSPDFTFDELGLGSVSINIPRTTDGKWWAGVYTVRILIVDSDAETPVTYIDETDSYNFQPTTTPSSAISDRIAVTAAADCSTGTITATGTYTDDGQQVDFPVISITPEAATGEEASVEEGESEMEYSFGYNGASYTARYQADMTDTIPFSESVTWYIIETVAAEETVVTDCVDADLCKAVSCVEKEFNELDARSCMVGWHILSDLDKRRLTKAKFILKQMLFYDRCSNQSKVNEYGLMLDDLLDCKCGCGPAPSAIQPYTAPNP